MRIVDGNVCVRDIYQSDAESYFEIFSHPDVARFDDFEPIDRDELARDMVRIANYKPHSLNREYAVSALPHDCMIGVLTVDMRRKYCYLGYHFNPSFHGKGYALTSVKLFLNALPNEVLKILRVVSDPDNKASLKLAQKAGFKQTARRKKNGKREVVLSLERSLVLDAETC